MKTGFGWIEIGDTTYEHDVIIHADGTITKRSKKRSKDSNPSTAIRPSPIMNSTSSRTNTLKWYMWDGDSTETCRSLLKRRKNYRNLKPSSASLPI